MSNSITVNFEFNFEKRQCEVILRKDKIRRILFDVYGKILKAENKDNYQIHAFTACNEPMYLLNISRENVIFARVSNICYFDEYINFEVIKTMTWEDASSKFDKYVQTEIFNRNYDKPSIGAKRNFTVKTEDLLVEYALAYFKYLE